MPPHSDSEEDTSTPLAAEGSGDGSDFVPGRDLLSPINLTPGTVKENSEKRTKTEDLRNDLQRKMQDHL